MTPTLQMILEIILGIGLLFGGGELFVQGAATLAILLGIPQLVIGLTVVSLGTSAPELFVSAGSLLKNSDAIAISNVIGSNIFNVLVVLGGSALIIPLKVESRLVKRDIPVLLAVTAAVWGMASSGQITWQSGLALLIALIINTIWEIRTAREDPQEIKSAEPEISLEIASNGWLKAGIGILSGIFLLGIGSNVLINGAKALAISNNLSEEVIGLTIVSAGTSMPELVTSLVASFRGRTDLAIGNVIGSSLLNLLLVLGSCALFSGTKGLNVESILIQKDFPIMLLVTLACMPIFWTKGLISRQEGAALLSLYALYLIDQVLPLTQLTIQEEFRFIVICLVLPISIIIVIFKTLKYWRFIKASKA